MVKLACVVSSIGVFFFKQKTAYEMRISDWSSDVCSSDLIAEIEGVNLALGTPLGADDCHNADRLARLPGTINSKTGRPTAFIMATPGPAMLPAPVATPTATPAEWTDGPVPEFTGTSWSDDEVRSEEHTSELQSLMRISYAVFCLKKKKKTNNN